MLAALRALPARGRAARECPARGTGYFANPVHGMDYPSYLARGRQIGSGPVECAGKTVIGQRRKGVACAGERTERTLSPPARPVPQRERAVGSILVSELIALLPPLQDAYPA